MLSHSHPEFFGYTRFIWNTAVGYVVQGNATRDD